MDWFEKLAGFREEGYEETRSKFRIDGQKLTSQVNGRSYGIGEFRLASLESFRSLGKSLNLVDGDLKVSVVRGDIRALHRASEYRGALIQVASQFNMLEMTGPDITPEHGVTRYQHDRTQGPACAIAAGAATIYRNYFVPVGQSSGQTADRQLNGLADIGRALSAALGMSEDMLWDMRNGYALCTRRGLEAIARHLSNLTPEETDSLRGLLRIGVQRNVEITDAPEVYPSFVTQAFCSALPIGYSDVPAPLWEAFASFILQAAYEATIWAAVLNTTSGTSNIALLTSLGGGAFGNERRWIVDAMKRALTLAKSIPLDIRIVSYGPPSSDLLGLET